MSRISLTGCLLAMGVAMALAGGCAGTLGECETFEDESPLAPGSYRFQCGDSGLSLSQLEVSETGFYEGMFPTGWEWADWANVCIGLPVLVGDLGYTVEITDFHVNGDTLTWSYHGWFTDRSTSVLRTAEYTQLPDGRIEVREAWGDDELSPSCILYPQ